MCSCMASSGLLLGTVDTISSKRITMFLALYGKARIKKTRRSHQVSPPRAPDEASRIGGWVEVGRQHSHLKLFKQTGGWLVRAEARA